MEALHCKIGTELEYVLLDPDTSRTVTGRDYWDADWIQSGVTVRAGAWQGRYRAFLSRAGFVSFRKQVQELYSSLSGEAIFTTVEDWIEVRLRGNGRGEITVEGTAWDRPGIGNRLEFHLPDIDQTFLPPLLTQLDAIIEHYPVIGQP